MFDAGAFAVADRTLAHPFYVAMTRAKAHLIISGNRNEQSNQLANQLLDVIQQSCDDLREAVVPTQATERESIHRLFVQHLGDRYASWIEDLLQRHVIDLSPLWNSDGQIDCEPLFHFRTPLFQYVCFGLDEVSDTQREELERRGWTVLSPGDRYE